MSQMQRASDDQLLNTTLEAIAGLVTEPYDYIEVNYTDTTKNNISSVVFKSGGSGGTTVRTITVAYPTTTQETYTAS